MFSCEFYQYFKATYFKEHLWMSASVKCIENSMNRRKSQEFEKRWIHLKCTRPWPVIIYGSRKIHSSMLIAVNVLELCHLLCQPWSCRLRQLSQNVKLQTCNCFFFYNNVYVKSKRNKNTRNRSPTTKLYVVGRGREELKCYNIDSKKKG